MNQLRRILTSSADVNNEGLICDNVMKMIYIAFRAPSKANCVFTTRFDMTRQHHLNLRAGDYYIPPYYCSG